MHNLLSAAGPHLWRMYWWLPHIILSYVRVSGSASASWCWWPLAVRLATSLEILCACWRTYKFSSPAFSLLCLAFWTEFIKLLWRAAMSPVSRANYSIGLSQPSLRDYTQSEKWHMPFGTDLFSGRQGNILSYCTSQKCNPIFPDPSCRWRRGGTCDHRLGTD